jgi:hypothetical protein
MIDTEVMRLRRLRNTALSARALAASLGACPSDDASAAADPHRHASLARPESLFSRGAVSCWQIARVITGRLRAHPYLSYQRGPSGVRRVYDRVRAGVRSGIARYRGRSLQIFSDELQRVARELGDARALTWSADLGDTWGRSQTQIRRLIQELSAAARQEAGSSTATVPPLVPRTDVVQDTDNVDGNWPYLAF